MRRLHHLRGLRHDFVHACGPVAFKTPVLYASVSLSAIKSRIARQRPVDPSAARRGDLERHAMVTVKSISGYRFRLRRSCVSSCSDPNDHRTFRAFFSRESNRLAFDEAQYPRHRICRSYRGRRYQHIQVRFSPDSIRSGDCSDIWPDKNLRQQKHQLRGCQRQHTKPVATRNPLGRVSTNRAVVDLGFERKSLPD